MSPIQVRAICGKETSSSLFAYPKKILIPAPIAWIESLNFTLNRWHMGIEKYSVFISEFYWAKVKVQLLVNEPNNRLYFLICTVEVRNEWTISLNLVPRFLAKQLFRPSTSPKWLSLSQTKKAEELFARTFFALARVFRVEISCISVADIDLILQKIADFGPRPILCKRKLCDIQTDKLKLRTY